MITGKRILITGSEGFIGSNLANTLVQQDNIVYGVDKEDRKLRDSRVRFHKFDLTKKRHILELFGAVGEVDYILHLCADMGGMGFIAYNPATIMNNNQRINLNALELYKYMNAKKIFFSSSACVYPQQLQNSRVDLKESDAIPANPDTAYGFEKLMMEQEMKAYKEQYGYNIRIARFHNVYGTGLIHSTEREKAPMSLCKKVLEAKDNTSIKVWGDGRQVRSFMFISDCIKGIEKLVESNYDEPLNIGSDEAVSITKLAEMVIAISKKNLKIEYELDKPQGVRYRNSDNTLCKKILGWSPSTPLYDGLKQTYEWLENQGDYDGNKRAI